MSMYRRYAPKQVNTKAQPEAKRNAEPTAAAVSLMSKNGQHSSCSPSAGSQRSNRPPHCNNTKDRQDGCRSGQKPIRGAESAQNKKTPRNPVSGFIPPAVYNPETKKVFGIFSAEDLLLAALIIILLDNDDSNGSDDSMLIYALIYILISDYIDLPF